MRRLTIILLLLLSVSVGALCQSRDAADRLFADKQYDKALVQYRQLLAGSPSSHLYQYRTARCLQELGQYEAAVPLFETSAARYPLAFYYLALCAQQSYLFDKAVEAADSYLTTEPADDVRVTRATAIKEQSRLAAHYMKRIADIAIIDSQVVDKEQFLQCYHLSADAGKIVRGGGGYIFTNQRGDQRVLSRGGTLCRQDKLLDKWERAEPLPLDSMAGADYPFLMPDGVTLYFGAQGEGSMGGYDIFITQYNDANQRYLTPENMGFPYNSPANDYMLAIDENAGIGWWCTDRRQPEGKVVVYSFLPNSETLIVSNEGDTRGRASLTKPRMAEKAHDTGRQTARVTARHDADSIFVEMYDGMVYRHLSDFHSDSAKQCYIEVQRIETQLQNTVSRLETLRRQYIAGDADTRENLRLAILNNEREVEELREKIKEQTRLMRKLEREISVT